MNKGGAVNWRIAITAAALLIGGPPDTLSAQEPPAPDVPAGAGLELIQRSCVGCHDLYTIIQKRKTPAEWANTLGLMADRGAEVTPAEMKVIQDYLAHHFAPRNTP